MKKNPIVSEHTNGEKKHLERESELQRGNTHKTLK